MFMFTMPKKGMVNVKMVITEEKILSNIEKIHKLIEPNSKRQIVELDDDSYFKDLVESIKTYLIEYPKKKNFPKEIYDAAYELVEYATNQFEVNTKQIDNLIKKREFNIKTAAILKQTLAIVQSGDSEWKRAVDEVSQRLPEDVVQALFIIGKSKKDSSVEYQAAMKLINAKIANLQSNLHIEIDLERVEDRSKALSYIGIEVADALKLIPAPEEQLEAVAEQNAIDEMAKETEAKERVAVAKEKAVKAEKVKEEKVVKAEEKEETLESLIDETLAETEDTIIQEQEQYTKETTFEAKPSLWQRFKNSKFVKAATYVFRIKVRIELPSNALPEGRGENV